MKIDVISYRLEKHLEFIQNKNLDFIDSIQFMVSSLVKLVKKLAHDDLKYLNQENSFKTKRCLSLWLHKKF